MTWGAIAESTSSQPKTNRPADPQFIDLLSQLQLPGTTTVLPSQRRNVTPVHVCPTPHEPNIIRKSKAQDGQVS